ncbi:MAG TPA: ATP-binding protein [Terriglobales bacterium]|nr:ATP-binding protein [Terriglobales bacterium]
MASVPIRGPMKKFGPSRVGTESGRTHDSAEIYGRELLPSAMDASPHAMMLEVDGRVVYANCRYAYLAGYPDARSLIGLPVEAVMLDSSCGCLQQGRSEHGATEAALASEASATAGLSIESTRTEVALGDRVLVIHVLRDVSSQRRLEEQLQESQKKEALGLVVSGVAHDFNNILTAITLHADLLLAQIPAGTWERRQAESIRSAAEKGTILGKQLLDFIRRKPAQAEAVSVNQALAEMRVMLQRLIGEHVDLVSDVRAQRSQVWINPGQLQQVVLNLMLNARDAMPGGDRIELETCEVFLDAEAVRSLAGLATGPYVRLTVSDNGVGMDAQTQTRVFEPFFATKENGAGTGLGLYTVRTIVRKSGGAVRLKSEPGQDTTVEIFLPLFAGAAEECLQK